MLTEARRVREQIGLVYQIQNPELKQAMLLAYLSQADQQLENWQQAEPLIKSSQDILSNFKVESQEFLQVQILAHKIQGDLLARQKQNDRAKQFYQKAFDILQSYPKQTSPFKSNNQFITSDDIESIHRRYLDLISNNSIQKQLREKVENSLTQHLYAQLEDFLKAKNWSEADQQTDRLMLNIAKREKEEYLDIESINNFSCLDLQKIDKLWIASDKRFGFSVQKEIYMKTGNKLGISLKDWSDKNFENYIQFAKAVGWYDDEKARDNDDSRSRGGWVDSDTLMLRIKENPKRVLRGVLPRTSGVRGIPYFGRFGWETPSVAYRVLLPRCDL